jgi:hypothetical protein
VQNVGDAAMLFSVASAEKESVDAARIRVQLD